MARMRRLEPPGALHHIMAHSIENKDMFLDNADRYEFLKRLARGLRKTGFMCYTWTLMCNHYHMLIRANHLKLEKLMRGLNGGYAQYYNRKYRKKGYLFQNRFKSVLCQDSRYAAELVKYINLNPLKAGMVTSFEQLKAYTWCGHGYLIGEEDAIGEDFQSRQECLSRFGDEEQTAIRNYMEFLEANYVENYVATESQTEALAEDADNVTASVHAEIVNSCRGQPAVLGDEEFVKKALEQHRSDNIHRHRRSDYPRILKRTAQSVCSKYGLQENELLRRGWKNARSKARICFCHHLHKNEHLPPSVIARYLKITIGPVSRMIEIGENLAWSNDPQ